MTPLRALLVAALSVPATVASTPSDAPATATPPAPTDARTLLSALATVTGLEARFRESKHLALLRQPLVSEGRLYYTRPGHLARFVDTPSESRVRLGPGFVEIRDAGGTQRIPLASRPELQSFVESFVRVLEGDYEALSSAYTLTFAPGPEADGHWTLTLVPRRAPLSTLVARMELEGRGYAIHRIRVVETHGDATVTEMLDVDHQREFSVAERQAIFGLRPATP